MQTLWKAFQEVPGLISESGEDLKNVMSCMSSVMTEGRASGEPCALAAAGFAVISSLDCR